MNTIIFEQEKLLCQQFQFEVITVNTQGEVIQRKSKQAHYQVFDIGNGVKLEMVLIKGGSFLMGSPNTEKGRKDDEGPQHTVTIPPFYMSKYLITQHQYEAVLGENPSKFNGKNRPVERVSWYEAIKFSTQLSEQIGKVYQLPSEAQWEYACRAGTTSPFYFGETLTTEFANYKGNCTYRAEQKGIYRRETSEVGQFPPNHFGLYDMHGNVWEWIADAWHDNYQGAPSDEKLWKEGKDEAYRVVRGGSLYRNPEECRSASRLRHSAEIRCQNLGFRIVLLARPINPIS